MTRPSALPKPSRWPIIASIGSTPGSCASSIPMDPACDPTTAAWCRTSSCRRSKANPSPCTVTARRRAAPHHRVFQRAHGGVSTRLLVTGAAGFIGSHVSEALLARGDEVVGVDNFDAFYPRAVKERNLDGLRRTTGFRFVEADIVRDALPLEGVSVVLHLAARPGVRPSLEDPASYGDTNVTGTVRVFEPARRAGLRRIVFGSSSSVYGDATAAPFAEDTAAVWPISPYAASKRAGELMAHAFAHLYGLQS